MLSLVVNDKVQKWIGIVFICFFVIVLTNRPVIINAAQVEQVTETPSDEENGTEISGTSNATFQIKINVPEGFTDEIQLLFYNFDDEYECVLSERNQYTISFSLKGNCTYSLMYYYKSYETYELEALQDTFVCEDGTLWKLEVDMVERTTPVEKKLFPLFGDMTEEELEEVDIFFSNLFPDMTESEVLNWYYEQIKSLENAETESIEGKNLNDSPLKNMVAGIKNETTESMFKSTSGTNEEWGNLTDAQAFTFYYSSVLPEIILESNDYDCDAYMDNLKLLEKSCDAAGTTELYEVTYKLWSYIWEYQKNQKQFPNFATYCITKFREEYNVPSLQMGSTEEQVQDQDSVNGNEVQDKGIGYSIIEYLLEHLVSIIMLLVGAGIMAYFFVKGRKEKKGKWVK